ncbi:hypothetical protein KJ068_26145 [bacterium]|nr:hypothetical protein [bacterium]
MKNFITLFSTAFLLLAFGCSKNPSQSAVGALKQVDELSKPASVGWYLTFKGKIEYSDGTVFESKDEKTIALPEHLWGSAWSEDIQTLGPDVGQNYYIEFVPSGLTVTIGQSSTGIFHQSGLTTHSCGADWSTRSIVTVLNNTTTALPCGATHYSLFYDGDYWPPVQSPINCIPPGVLGGTGTFNGQFSNEVSFENTNGYVDVNRVIVKNNDPHAGGVIEFLSIRYHLRSRNIACS